MIAELVYHAGTVQAPRDLCWSVQYGAVWRSVFHSDNDDGAAARLIRFKVRRLVFDDVRDMERFPNFKGARVLGFCLNVLGLRVSGERMYRDTKALHEAILSWTRRNYRWLHDYNSKVADACLTEDFSYDAKHSRLVKTQPAEALRLKPSYTYLELDPPGPDRKQPESD